MSLKTRINNGQFTGTLDGTPTSGTLDLSNISLTLPASTQFGFDYKASVRAATTANITLTAAQTIDGISVVAADRVLVKNQTAPAENGIYLCASGSWTRAADFDLWAEVPGSIVAVELGTANADTVWLCSADQGGTIGSTSVTFTKISINQAAVAITGGTMSNVTIENCTINDTTISGNTITSGAGILTLSGTGTFAANISAGRTLTFIATNSYSLTITGSGTLNLAGYTLTATASGNIYVSGGTDVDVADGGTGRSTGTTAYALVATGTTATGAQQTLASGATTEVLVGGGASALPVWTTATGSGAPVRATSPTLVTPNIGAATATSINVGTGQTVTKILTATASLSFSAANQESDTETMTVTGAAVGDCVVLGLPHSDGPGSNDGGWFAWVSFTDTVSIRFTNHTANPISPNSATYRATVIKF